MSRHTLIDQFGPPLRMQVVEGQDSGRLVVEGKIGHVDKPTANNRMYPRGIMEREIKRLQPRIEQGSVIGAVDHPGDGKSRIRDAGCIVRGLWVENTGEIKGRFEVVEESDAGRNLAAFLRRGAAIGMSSRGVGSTATGPQGWDVVGEDFRLATWDFVADPACHDAYPTVISEDVDGEGNPTGKLVLDPAKLTESELRQRFPALVRSIEEHAFEVASETCVTDTEERLREKIEGEVEEGITSSADEIRDSIKLEVYEEVRRELEEDFAVKLVRALSELRETVTEEVRSEMDSDPINAAAKVQLKRIAEMVTPFVPAPDTQKLLDEKDKEIVELRRSIDESVAKTERVQKEKLVAEQKGKTLAYSVFIERQVAAREDADRLREMIGDPTSFRSAEELKTKVEAVLSRADAMAEQATKVADARYEQERARLEQRAELAERERDTARREKDRFRGVMEDKLARIEGTLKSVLAERDETLTARERALVEETEKVTKTAKVGLRGHLVGYAAKRTVGVPAIQSQIIEDVEQGRLTTKDDIDAEVRKLEEGAHEPGGLSERMRRALSRGREHPVEEDEKSNHEPIGFGEADEDLQFLGTSLTEQENLAGRLRQRTRR